MGPTGQCDAHWLNAAWDDHLLAGIVGQYQQQAHRQWQ
eukprot:SAG25_NODE_14329_length_256_cov_0.662420_2_plen_37_part_01